MAEPFVGSQQRNRTAGLEETYKVTKPSEQPDALPAVCSDCGAVYMRLQTGSGRCDECRPVPVPIARVRVKHGTTSARGYDTAWRRLSERARALQPWCTDCGRRDDLTADHTPDAWARRESGKVLRLSDISVVCRSCNAERGAARGRRITHRPNPYA